LCVSKCEKSLKRLTLVMTSLCIFDCFVKKPAPFFGATVARPEKPELYVRLAHAWKILELAVSMTRVFKQPTGFFPIAQPCGDSTQAEKRIGIARLVGTLGIEGDGALQSNRGSFSASLSLENRADPCERNGFAPTLLVRPE
jgi:hypothetical protein